MSQANIVKLSPPRWWIGVGALLCVAAFLMLNIHALHMHEDEELSYRATNGDLAFAIHWQTSLQDNQAPLWFVTFSAWRALVGDAEFTSRVLGIFLTLVACAFTYRVGRAAFGVSGAALALIALIGNGFFFQYALDIRPYPLVMLAAAFSFWTLQRWLRIRSIRAALVYGIAIALMLYVHYLLLFVVAAQAIYVLFSRRLSLRLMAQGVSAGVIGVLMFAPWFPVFIRQVTMLQNVEAASGTGRGIAGIGVSTQATTPDTIARLLNLATNSLLPVYTLVLIVSLVFMWRKSLWLSVGLWLTWAILAPAVYLLANTVAAVYAPRFVSHAMLGVGLVIGAGLAALPVRWRRFPVRAAAVIGFVALNVLTFYPSLPQRVPFRDIFQAVSAETGAVVYMQRAREDDGYVQYLIRTWMSPALVSSITSDFTRADAARQVWFITGDWFNDDVQARFAQLERTHPLQTVLGKCDRAWCYLAQLMQAPPLHDQAPFVFGGVLPFFGVDVDSVSGSAIHTRLWWRADQAPPLDYSLSLQLNDDNGGLVAQSDGAINHYDREIVQTSQMQPEQIYIDHRTLTLPQSLPSGTYMLSLVVYQSWDGVRLTLASGEDRLRLDSILIDH